MGERSVAEVKKAHNIQMSDEDLVAWKYKRTSGHRDRAVSHRQW